jgi:hypothetical protein
MTDTLPNLTTCRDCLQPIGATARVCPHCGAPYPANHAWNGWGYEYKSKATLLGLPLVHIAFGRDKNGKLRTARGILAIGQFARGVVTIAQFGYGVICIAQFGVGILGVGQVILALAAIGQFPIALYAIGQIPVALFWAKGQVPIVWR